MFSTSCKIDHNCGIFTWKCILLCSMRFLNAIVGINNIWVHRTATLILFTIVWPVKKYLILGRNWYAVERIVLLSLKVTLGWLLPSLDHMHNSARMFVYPGFATPFFFISGAILCWFSHCQYCFQITELQPLLLKVCTCQQLPALCVYVQLHIQKSNENLLSFK